MDLLWYILSFILMLTGIAGCILPLLPGPPLAYLALLVVQLTTPTPFTSRFMIIIGTITFIATVLDYVIPAYGTKKFGGSKYGIWGCTLGLIIGLFFPPWGIVAGPFIGAFLGELLFQGDSTQALRAAWGSFIGFLLSVLLKLVVCLLMFFYLVKSAIERF